ncbi:MAG: hypothetical protein KAI57_05160 [Candidatus Pacebacteria bacterium]|nr:hypothetical protein [Candidatus Paceibacterota bacterium]
MSEQSGGTAFAMCMLAASIAGMLPRSGFGMDAMIMHQSQETMPICTEVTLDVQRDFSGGGGPTVFDVMRSSEKFYEAVSDPGGGTPADMVLKQVEALEQFSGGGLRGDAWIQGLEADYQDGDPGIERSFSCDETDPQQLTIQQGFDVDCQGGGTPSVGFRTAAVAIRTAAIAFAS